MRAPTFWKTVIGEGNHLEELLAFLSEHRVGYCVVDGHAVNTYVDPLVSLDLDLAVAAGHLDSLEGLLAFRYSVERFAHSLNVAFPGSDLRVQFQTDARYGEFVAEAEQRDVLGLSLPVARLQDVLQGKVWAAQDTERRASKRQKDLADIACILEAYPELKSQVPADVLAKLI